MVERAARWATAGGVAMFLTALAGNQGITTPDASPAMAAAPAEACPAAAAWFDVNGAPLPSNVEPKRGSDCDFYQRAFQHFLYAVAGPANNPRFLSYKSYSDEFGADPGAGLLSAPRKSFNGQNMMVLAPRLVKSAQTADAQDILQAGSNALLLDQNGHPIFYNIFMNPVFSGVIETRHYNDIKVLKAVDPEEELPAGVVEFKAAWQIVDPGQTAADRIVVQARVPWLIADPAKPGKLQIDKTRPLRVVTVALIGLHVVFVPENHPEMVWATFEYDRNAPAAAGNPVTYDQPPLPNCYNPGEPRNDTISEDGQPYLLYAKGTPLAAANQRPKAITVIDPVAQTFGPKPSIVRRFPFSGCFSGLNPANAVTEIDPAIAALNESFIAQNKSAWLAHYRLVGAAWLDEPRNPNDELAFKSGATFDDMQIRGENRLSSASMESFTQTSSPNCFACHDTNAKGNLGPKRISVSHMFRRFSLDSK